MSIMSYISTLLSRASETLRKEDEREEQEKIPTNFCKDCRYYDDRNPMRRYCLHDESFRGVDLETGEKQYRLAINMRDYECDGPCGYMGDLFVPKEELQPTDNRFIFQETNTKPN